MKHTVLLGDPSFFRIKGGRNFYTRDCWGFRKRVDPQKAKEQWLRFKETLESLGANVHVMPAHPDFPGMVFPANAGFLHPKYAPVPLSEKKFQNSCPKKLLPKKRLLFTTNIWQRNTEN